MSIYLILAKPYSDGISINLDTLGRRFSELNAVELFTDAYKDSLKCQINGNKT